MLHESQLNLTGLVHAMRSNGPLHQVIDMDHGPLYVDQRYHYVRPSLRSNHNENMLLLLEGHFW
jgi:hypothetical protein